MRRYLLLSIAGLLCQALAAAGSLTVSVSGTSPTQAVLSYSAPDANPCTVEVSESGSYSPLVHDVDPVLFAGSNRDSRTGALAGSGIRIFVAGTRTIEPAADSRKYSRALQQNIRHYFRVTCSGQSATGSFTTMTLPFGTTYQDLLPMDAAGHYNYPSTSDTNRAEELVDPQTGVLIKRINLSSDNTANSAPYPTAGGFGEACSSGTDAQGFYHCMFNDVPQGIFPNLYAIHPATGESRFLGAAYFFRAEIDPQGASLQGLSGGGERVMWDASNPNVAYVTVTINDTHRTTIAKWTYTGLDNPANNLAGDPKQSPHSVVDLLGGQDLTVLAHAFNDQMDVTKFVCSAVGLQSHYFLLRCARGYQNTYAWEGAYDVGNGLPLGSGGNGHIIALAPGWARTGSRWCADHSYEFVGNVPILSFAVHSLSGLSSPPYDGGGPYTSTLTANMPPAARGALTTINVSSSWDTASWGAAPSQWVSGEPVSPNPDHFLQTVQVGDMFSVDYELVRLSAKVSPTVWLVERGLTDTAPLSHTASSLIYAQCETTNSLLTSSGGYVWWDFVASANGLSTSDWVLNFGTHPVSRGNYRVDSGYPIRTGAVTDKSTWGRAPDIGVTSHPFFGGKSAPGDGNAYQKHVSMASGDDRSFFDETYFVGTSLFSAQGPGAVTHISGNLYQYHYETGVGSSSGTPIARKHFPTLAKTKGQGLIDASGPGAVLGDTGADSYKYCVAVLAGECHAGSSPGDIFFNHPELDPNYQYCTGGENGLGVSDICIGNFAPMGVASMQYKIVNDLTGALSYRPLSRTFHNYEGPTLLSGNLKVTYGAEWAIMFVIDHPAPNPVTRALALKVPPMSAGDGINRGTFVPALLELSAPRNIGVVSARVKFGYSENGPPASYFCTSRHEACVATAATVNENDPFRFAVTEAVTPTPCMTSCTVALPVYPLHTAYYLAEFLDSQGNVVANTRGVAVENSVAGFQPSLSLSAHRMGSSRAAAVQIRGLASMH